MPFCYHCYHLCYHKNITRNLQTFSWLLILVIAVIAKIKKNFLIS